MKNFELNLRMFDGHSVTVYGDAGVSSISASPNSSVAKDTEVTLTVTLESGYEVDEYECVAGGVTVNASTKKFAMGEADAVIYLKTKADNKYLVTEECMANVNDTKVILHKNVKVQLTPNGVVKGVTVESGGASITLTDAIQNLIDQGILVKI